MSRSQPHGTSALPGTLELVESEPGRFRCCLWHNISLLIWTDQATLEAVKKLKRVTELLIERYPSGHSNVSFVLNGVRPPTPEARAAFAHAFNDRVSMLRCMTTITEGDGFWASTLRSAITSMRMESSQGLLMQLHDTIAAAAEWLPEPHFQRTSVKISAKELVAALHRFRHGG
jgi:hypothetical protein